MRSGGCPIRFNSGNHESQLFFCFLDLTPSKKLLIISSLKLIKKLVLDTADGSGPSSSNLSKFQSGDAPLL